MIILHYIPSLQKSMGQTAQFAQMLRDVMGKTIETHIISGAVSRSEFVKRLAVVNPDIVHLHGCWSLRVAMAERWAIKRGYPVVLSPHDGLSQKMLHDNFWKKRVPQTIAYQLRTVKKAFVLHASSTQELKDLKELGWKKRIALIPYPKSEQDYQMLCDSFHALYQKVIDTTLRNRLHNREQEALWTLLHAAITQRHAHMELSEQQAKHLHELTAHNWQAVQVYAIDHRIKHLLTEGAETLDITMPEDITETPPRYSMKPAFHSGMPTNKEKKLTAQYAQNSAELTIATNLNLMFRALVHCELREQQPSPIEMLCTIAEQLRWTDYDEEVLVKIISDFGIRAFASRLMQIMSETLLLTIGFMPLDPIDDNKTEDLRKKLNNLI